MKIEDLFEELAKENGYRNKFEFLVDYGIHPSVQYKPTHKSYEIIFLIIKHKWAVDNSGNN